MVQVDCVWDATGAYIENRELSWILQEAPLVSFLLFLRLSLASQSNLDNTMPFIDGGPPPFQDGSHQATDQSTLLAPSINPSSGLPSFIASPASSVATPSSMLPTGYTVKDLYRKDLWVNPFDLDPLLQPEWIKEILVIERELMHNPELRAQVGPRETPLPEQGDHGYDEVNLYDAAYRAFYTSIFDLKDNEGMILADMIWIDNQPPCSEARYRETGALSTKIWDDGFAVILWKYNWKITQMNAEDVP